MKLSFTTLGCPDWTLEQIAANAKAHGYDGVELRTQTDGNHCSPDATPEQAKRIARIFAAQGVAIMSIMGYCTFAHRDPAEVDRNQALMRKLFALAEATGAPHVRSFAGRLPEGATHAQMLETVAGAFKPLAAEAAKRGVSIALETHDDWCGSDLLLELTRLVDSKRGFGLVFDICNCIVAGHDWRKTYRRLKAHIRYCHVKDAWRSADGVWHYAPMGAGDLPWREVVKTLKKDRYRGFLSFEWEKKWHPELEPPERVFPQYTHKMRGMWAEKT